MRSMPLVTGEYYHVFNRGVNHVEIFHDFKDFLRFYQSLYLFNDANYRHEGGDPVQREVLLAAHEVLSEDREPFVKIIAFCLMSNHFHLFLQQLRDDGISDFMFMISKGYAQYHNLRHSRSGPLFEGRFKATLVDHESYFQHVPRYIHLNVLDGTNLNWREGQVTDWSLAAEKFRAYPWSSHSVYLHQPQELPVVDTETVHQLFPNPIEYESFLRGWSGRYFIPHFD